MLQQTRSIHPIINISQNAGYKELLVKSHQEYQSLAENAPFNITRFDLRCKATYANARIVNLFRETGIEIIGKTPLEAFPNGVYEGGLGETIEYMEHIKLVICTGKNQEMELHIPLANGKLGTHHIVFTPEKDIEGNLIGVLAYGNDITHLKTIEEALIDNEKKIRKKLNSVLSPEHDFSELELSDILDSKTIQHLVDEFCKVSNIPMGITDKNGKILAKGAWQDVCTRFHRGNPKSCKLCIESDVELSQNIEPGTFKQYRCKNNMWDIATPIMIGDKYAGNIFMGQFLYADEITDTEIYIEQAHRYGYNEDEYLESLSKVPRVSRQKADEIMSFLASFAGVISNLSYTNLKLAKILEQQNQMESKIRHQADFQQLLLNGIKDVGITILITEQGKVIYNNGIDDEYQMGITREQNPKFPDFIDLIHPCDRTKVMEIFNRRIQGATGPESFEIGVTNLLGERHEYEVFLAVIPDTTPSQTIIFAKDITDRKMAEEQLKKKQSNLEEAQRLGRIGSWEFNQVTNEFEWSSEMYRIFKVDPNSYVPSYNALLEAIHFEDRDYVDQTLQRSIEEKKTFDVDHRLLFPDGKTKYVSQHGITYYDNQGNPLRSIGTMRDMTQRKEAELELVEAKNKAEESNRLKSAFLATMNHELRTPLNHIIGFSKMLEWNPEKTSEYSHIIQHSANHLLEMIEDVFMLSMANDSGLIVRNQEFDLATMFFTSQQILTEILDNSGKRDQIELKLNIDARLSKMKISADLNKINQVLGNLFKNAVKFTNQGYINFGVQAETEGWLTFYVTDTGIGIPENKHSIVFDFFRQADDSNTRKHEGIGIGLAISKRITEVLGGTLTFCSTPGIGSTFYLKVPVKTIIEQV